MVRSAKQHSYEELRGVVVDVLLDKIPQNNQYSTLVEHPARALKPKENKHQLATRLRLSGRGRSTSSA